MGDVGDVGDADDPSLPSAPPSDEDDPSLPSAPSSDEDHQIICECQSDSDDIAEFYSPPRVVPYANMLGLRGHKSFDLKTHVDFRVKQQRHESLRMIENRKVKFLLLEPPCTAFSSIQYCFNKKKMHTQKFKQCWSDGMLFLKHCMDCAKVQIDANPQRYFVFEHPCQARSFKQHCVREIYDVDGVYRAVFDQCCFGARTKVKKDPVRKRTVFLTNSPVVHTRFHQRFCRELHTHVHLTGQEGGVSRTKYAEMYPPALCEALAECAHLQLLD